MACTVRSSDSVELQDWLHVTVLYLNQIFFAIDWHDPFHIFKFFPVLLFFKLLIVKQAFVNLIVFYFLFGWIIFHFFKFFEACGPVLDISMRLTILKHIFGIMSGHWWSPKRGSRIKDWFLKVSQ